MFFTCLAATMDVDVEGLIHLIMISLHSSECLL